MRRGLMKWDEAELPRAVLEARIERLREEMARAGLDAVIVYTNLVRSAGVHWLTGFSPYWADGVLMVPRAGEPVFATTLSNRVASWVRSVKPIGDLVHSPQPGAALGDRVTEMARIGVVELDDLPSGIYDDLAAKRPDAEIVDASGVFAAARRSDDAERGFLCHADTVARDALTQVAQSGPHTVGGVIGPVEEYARLRGAEEAYLAIAPDLVVDRRFLRLSGDRPCGAIFAVRISLAYKGNWVRRIRTFGNDPAIPRADAWFEGLMPGSDIADEVRRLLGATLRDSFLEATIGTRPLAVLNGAPDGVAPTLTVSLDIDTVPWCGARLFAAAPS
jgi:Creatinase/Prolidase N-terminal domain